MEYLVVDGKIILKWMECRVWSGLILSRMATSGGLVVKNGKKNFRYCKTAGSSSLTRTCQVLKNDSFIEVVVYVVSKLLCKKSRSHKLWLMTVSCSVALK